MLSIFAPDIRAPHHREYLTMTSPEKAQGDESLSLETEAGIQGEEENDELKTLKYHLLGPSLTKAGQDKVDQSKVSLGKWLESSPNLRLIAGL